MLLVFQYVKAAPGDQLFSILIVAWLNLPQGRTGLETWEKKKMFLSRRVVKPQNRKNREVLGWHSWGIFKRRLDKHPSEMM